MPHPPSSESESFQIVLLGSFNPAIFHPQWFSRFGLVGADEMVNEQVKVVSPEFTDIGVGPIHLQCVPDRFTFETGNIAYLEKLRDLTEGLLSLLPHTPIKGCGLNSAAHYRIESIEYWHKVGHTLAPKELVWNNLFPGNPPPGLMNLVIQAKRGGNFAGAVNITVAPSAVLKPGLFIASNHHYDTPAELLSAGSAAQIRSFIHDFWPEASESAKVVGRTIFDKIPFRP